MPQGWMLGLRALMLGKADVNMTAADCSLDWTKTLEHFLYVRERF
jgi:hypothetical protein